MYSATGAGGEPTVSGTGIGFSRAWCRRRVPITAVAAGRSRAPRRLPLRLLRRRSGVDFATRRTGFATPRTGFATAPTGLLAPAFGSPTSAPSGGGSGARSSPGASRTPSRAMATIAAARATPPHLIRTPAISG